jgi:hypothetical protein
LRMVTDYCTLAHPSKMYTVPLGVDDTMKL